MPHPQHTVIPTRDEERVRRTINEAHCAHVPDVGTTLSKISGTLPKSIGAPLRSMSMTNQALSGTLPEMPHFFAAPIEHVHLSGNAISGTFPNSWTYSELTRLVFILFIFVLLYD